MRIESQKMEPTTNTVVGLSASGASVTSFILYWCGIITPVAATIAAIGGVIVLFYSIKNHLHRDRMNRLEEAKHQEDFEKYNL